MLAFYLLANPTVMVAEPVDPANADTIARRYLFTVVPAATSTLPEVVVLEVVAVNTVKSAHVELFAECCILIVAAPLRVLAVTCRCPTPPFKEDAELSTLVLFTVAVTDC